MNLIIDQGNTQIKVGVFDKSKLLHTDSLIIPDENKLLELKKKYAISKCIFSSVVKPEDPVFIRELRTLFPDLLELSHTTPLPFKVNYNTKGTLGKDRVAAVAGASGLYPNKDILIIDAGTAITYEVFSQNEQYMGGNISPGLKMRFKALHQFTSQLPLIEPAGTCPLIGTSTAEAIQSGVLNGMLYEIEGCIAHVGREYPGIMTLITGGDADFFARKLKKPIFVDFNLVLVGLNRILEYNV